MSSNAKTFKIKHTPEYNAILDIALRQDEFDQPEAAEARPFTARKGRKMNKLVLAGFFIVLVALVTGIVLGVRDSKKDDDTSSRTLPRTTKRTKRPR